MAFIGANVAASAAAAAAVAKKRVILQLREKQATSHDSATSFVSQRREDNRCLEILLDRGVVVEAAPGRYWLNERTQRTKPRSKVVMLLLGLVVLALGAVALGLSLAQ